MQRIIPRVGTFKEKFKLLPLELQEKIWEETKEFGAFATAGKYYQQANMARKSLYVKLKKGKAASVNQDAAYEKAPVERKLNKEEKVFLQKLKLGDADLNDASKFVAVRVFEQMLKNPDQFKFIDFFRTELLRIKRDEVGVKDAFAKEIIGKMFAGKLPPSRCPHCRRSLMETEPVLRGEEINEERHIPSSL